MRNRLLFAFVFAFMLSTCSKNEEEEVEPIRDIQEQALADDAALQNYLKSHFYNYKDFENEAYQGEIVIDSIKGTNSAQLPLSSQVEKEVVRVRTSEGNFIDHTLYYLVVREGSGASPSVVDSTYLSYQGSLLNGVVFDESTTPIWFDLTSLVRGFKEGATKLKEGTFSVNEDNTVDFFNYGKGVLFFPSGMGYFSRASGVIPSYSPLIFKINLYGVKQTDHDGDGILSIDEYDTDADGVPDDTDEDGIPDYLDAE